MALGQLVAERKRGFLLVANWPSDVGFAWWLMESYWAVLAHHYQDRFKFYLTFPEVNEIPEVVRNAPIEIIQRHFGRGAVSDDLEFLRQYEIAAIYFSDRPVFDPRYRQFRKAGVEHIITHDHTPGQRTPPRGLKRWLKWLRIRLPGVSSDSAIGATEFVRQRTIDTNLMPANRCFAVPNGLPRQTDNVVADPDEQLGLPGDAVHMVMTGRANPYKGLRFILECLSEYRSRSEAKNLHFTLLGNGPILDDLRELASQLSISHFTHFPGYINNVNALLPGFDFAIHPSRGEVGYSLAILEYMRAGLPVIVPDNPSVCGATRHEQTGLIFPEGDRTACVNALQRLTDDTELRSRLGAAAREDEQRFSLENAHRRLIEAVDATLAR
ncbi:MAG: glycosyltransferase family 4 protein [Pseudomonadota bacterium]